MSIRTPRLSTVRSGISSALGKYWAVKGDSSSSSAGSDLVAADAERTPLFTRILVYAFRTELATGVTTIKLRVAYLYEVAQKRPSGHGRSKSPLAALLDESARRGRLKLSAEQAELLYDGSHCSPPMPGHSQTEDKRLIVTFYNATKVEVWDDLDVYLLSRDGTHHVCMQVLCTVLASTVLICAPPCSDLSSVTSFF